MTLEILLELQITSSESIPLHSLPHVPFTTTDFSKWCTVTFPDPLKSSLYFDNRSLTTERCRLQNSTVTNITLERQLNLKICCRCVYHFVEWRVMWHFVKDHWVDVQLRIQQIFHHQHCSPNNGIPRMACINE